jgi:hypothetical protein
MEETRLAEIEERLANRPWECGLAESHDVIRDLLAEVRGLREELDALQICGRRTGHGGQADVCKLPKGHDGCHKGNVYWWKI